MGSEAAHHEKAEQHGPSHQHHRSSQAGDGQPGLATLAASCGLAYRFMPEVDGAAVQAVARAVKDSTVCGLARANDVVAAGAVDTHRVEALLFDQPLVITARCR